MDSKRFGALLLLHLQQYCYCCTATSTAASPTQTTAAPTPAPTTTTMASDIRCPAGRSNTAGLTTNGVTLQDAGDTADPVAHSESCMAGERNYWNSATVATPDEATGNSEKAIGVQCPTAADICVCSCEGVCCTPGPTPPDTVSFIPYCSGGDCEMYAFLEGDEDGISMTCTDGSTYTKAQQTNADGTFKPVNSGSYLKSGSVSCNSCDGIKGDTCKANILDGGTTIS